MNERDVRGIGFAGFQGAIFGALVLGALRSGIGTVGADYPPLYWLSGAVAGALLGILVRSVLKRRLR